MFQARAVGSVFLVARFTFPLSSAPAVLPDYLAFASSPSLRDAVSAFVFMSSTNFTIIVVDSAPAEASAVSGNSWGGAPSRAHAAAETLCAPLLSVRSKALDADFRFMPLAELKSMLDEGNPHGRQYYWSPSYLFEVCSPGSPAQPVAYARAACRAKTQAPAINCTPSASDSQHGDALELGRTCTRSPAEQRGGGDARGRRRAARAAARREPVPSPLRVLRGARHHFMASQRC